jgi:hypothetical protein
MATPTESYHILFVGIKDSKWQPGDTFEEGKTDVTMGNPFTMVFRVRSNTGELEDNKPVTIRPRYKPRDEGHRDMALPLCRGSQVHHNIQLLKGAPKVGQIEIVDCTVLVSDCFQGVRKRLGVDTEVWFEIGKSATRVESHLTFRD